MSEENRWLSNVDGVIIKSCETNLDLEDTNRFTKLNADSHQKMCVSAFVQQLPTLTAVGASSDIYVATFPKGVPHVLSKLSSGGYFSAIRGDNGQMIGMASLHPISGVAAVAGVFTVMSIITSQYYLTEINNRLGKIQLGIDKILDFLYGEKSAELMSEIVFVKYAHENFASIMQHNEQRVATISGLQNARKTAMKDLEFYIVDLDRAKDESSKDISSYANRALQIKSCLELSMQLYTLSGLMEMCYSQNYDEAYISNVERSMTQYLDKSEKHILQDFAVVANKVLSGKVKGFEETKAIISNAMTELNSGEESELRKSLRSALRASERTAEYYITQDGSMYLKKA